ncbi:GNAT family N-acetyltransferase [Kitasatospora sp. NPDC002227]|uniref:GNAT family N-acetyltransferase n=1 Tax=Kitasatospora sp. NPDC002227 TaxID=3154773 RepID=UPI00331BC86C
MAIEFLRYTEGEAERLVAFLAGEEWPFHGRSAVTAEQVSGWLADGLFESAESRTFWIVVDGETAGLVRLSDLGDETPLFDLRLAAGHRGRGIGTRAVGWLTAYLFTEFPGVERIEGHTRQDNTAMRRAFRRNGYLKEAHHRLAWPAADGSRHDSIGYGVLRRDWAAGEVTPLDWEDEPVSRPGG